MRHSSLPWRWHNKKYYGPKVPPTLAQWLFATGSLTERIRQYSHNDFRVRLLSQAWQRPRLDETHVLNLRPRENAVVREVELLCGDKAWVFARSVFPENTLIGKGAALHALGTKPLIEVLARDARLSRSDFEITTLPMHHPYLRRAAPPSRTETKLLWARRSLFYFYGKPLLVTEIFLPAVEDS